MTKVKVTIKTDKKTYVSVEIPGHGSNNKNYSVGKTIQEITYDDFNSFHGTPEEWQVIMETAAEIKIENIGHD